LEGLEILPLSGMPFLLVLRKTWIAFRHLVQSKRRRRQRSFFFSVAILGSLVLLQTKHMHTVSTTPETVYSLNHGQAIEDSAPSLTWEFHGYSQSNIPARSTSPSTPRLLIAQYASAFYTVVLNETQRVNQAYAERFNHDFIVCRGIYLTDSPWWRLVSPPLHTIAGSRSTYNKIAVLAYAMQHDYDRVLILDSDAMVRDFSINMATYSLTDDKGKDVVVVAQQAKMGEVHPPNTWNVKYWCHTLESPSRTSRYSVAAMARSLHCPNTKWPSGRRSTTVAALFSRFSRHYTSRPCREGVRLWWRIHRTTLHSRKFVVLE
jgi:hypothetical protein